MRKFREVTRLAPPSDHVDQDFAIAPVAKTAPESFQIGAKLRMVVNFAVKS